MSPQRRAKMLRRKERQLEKHIKLRHFLFHAQGGVCFFCEQPFSMVRPATIEHLVPRSLGGTNERDNLALTHSKCNSLRGVRSIIEAITFLSNPPIRKHWKRYQVSGYLPKKFKLSSLNPV